MKLSDMILHNALFSSGGSSEDSKGPKLVIGRNGEGIPVQNSLVISDETPTVQDLAGGFCAWGEGYDFDLSIMVEGINILTESGVVAFVTPDTGETIFMVVNQEVAQAMGVPSGILIIPGNFPENGEVWIAWEPK